MPCTVALGALLDQIESLAQRSSSVLAYIDLALVRAIYVGAMAVENGDTEVARTCASTVETLSWVARLMEAAGTEGGVRAE